MAMFWTSLTLIIAMQVTSAKSTENRIRSVTKTLDFDLESKLSGVALQNTSFWHVSCSDKETGPNVTCTVQLRIQTFSLTSYAATCTLSVDRLHPNTTMNIKMFIPFNDNELILGLGEFHESLSTVKALKFVIINMKKCSTTTSLIELDDADNSHNSYCDNVVVLTREKEFEVSYQNTTFCKFRCVEIFDNHGNRLKGPFDFNLTNMAPANYIEQWPVAYDNFDCFVVRPQERINSSLVFKEATMKLRYHIGTPKWAGISTANGNVTICHRLDSEARSLHCTRNDFKFWIELDFERGPIFSFVIRNLPGGEFLILTLEENVTVHLNKFDIGGRFLGKIEVTKLSCHDTHELLVHLFEKSEKGIGYYCVSLIYGKDRLNFMAECYPRDVFPDSSKVSKSRELSQPSFHPLHFHTRNKHLKHQKFEFPKVDMD
ncbi:hypothetical protein QAD02_012086 [Eretmocerus hayati]|uniref:Uncharacterized protein n=1 Tax=Eretmocerus hayati TaxID=131215 RepID=A0ACC2NYD8_9HYME|nr:hypothetical protein QAD02_012086 [Eretmocerus hayati]